METKHYLSKEGLIRLIKDLSSKIKVHTSTSINSSVPNNFPTNGAVIQYASNAPYLTINQYQSSETQGGNYTTSNVPVAYNGYGSGAKVLNVKLIESTDIDQLFVAIH